LGDGREEIDQVLVSHRHLLLQLGYNRNHQERPQVGIGRPWPDSWRGNEPSLIRNGDYKFHWFNGGDAYSSFPSGHMAAAVAVLSVLWIYYPRLRPLCLAAAVLLAIALIGSNFHFAGDVLAGGFVGMTVGWMTVSLFDQYPNGWRAKKDDGPGQ
jgi:membrane-associated phospholipid phosphatase